MSPETSSRPNVVFIVIDAVRPDHTSCYGYERDTTPVLSDFRSDAVRFEKAFAAGTFTPPSHASMFTGRYVSEHGYTDSLGEISDPLLAEVLAENGYDTASVVKNPNLGIREPLSRGFGECYEVFRAHPRTVVHSLKNREIPLPLARFRQYYLRHLGAFVRELTNGNRSSTDGEPATDFQTRIFTDFVRQKSGGSRPFFLFTNFTHAHSGYYPGREAIERCPFDVLDPDDVDGDRLRKLAKGHELYRYMTEEIDVDEAEWEAIRDWYDVDVWRADAQIGAVLESLRAAGEYQNTLIVVTADHGEHFGEHGLALHNASVYDELMHVPLLVKFPGGEFAGETVTGLASHVDLFDTICECADVDGPPTSGRSMYPLSDYEREYVFAEYPQNVSMMSSLGTYTNVSSTDRLTAKLFTHFQCVRTERYKYVRKSDGPDELYDLEADPDESTNRFEEVEEAVRAELRATLDAHLGDLPDVESIAPNHPDDVVANVRRVQEVDAVERQHLEDLGYL